MLRDECGSIPRFKVIQGGLSNRAESVLSWPRIPHSDHGDKRRDRPREGDVKMTGDAVALMAGGRDRTDASERARTAKIEVTALALLERHDLLQEPVDVIALAQRMNITVYKATFEANGISGAIAKRTEKSGRIWVNRLEALTRQRFTIAHEIGHWVLHMVAGDALSDPQKLIEWRLDVDEMSIREVEANRFAAALLMPAPLVRSALEQLGSDVERLAQRFDVSTVAMTRRLTDLENLD